MVNGRCGEKYLMNLMLTWLRSAFHPPTSIHTHWWLYSMNSNIQYAHMYCVKMTNKTCSFAQWQCVCDQLRRIMGHDWTQWLEQESFIVLHNPLWATLSLMGGGEFKALPHTTCCQRLPQISAPYPSAFVPLTLYDTKQHAHTCRSLVALSMPLALPN